MHILFVDMVCIYVKIVLICFQLYIFVDYLLLKILVFLSIYDISNCFITDTDHGIIHCVTCCIKLEVSNPYFISD